GAVRGGAGEVGAKPKTRADAEALREQIRRLAGLPVHPRSSVSAPVPAYTDPVPERAPERAGPPTRRIIGIACSAGGPRAVATILAGMPADLAATLIIVQHLPPGFPRPFARYLPGQTRLRVLAGRRPVLLGAAPRR